MRGNSALIKFYKTDENGRKYFSDEFQLDFLVNKYFDNLIFSSIQRKGLYHKVTQSFSAEAHRDILCVTLRNL